MDTGQRNVPRAPCSWSDSLHDFFHVLADCARGCDFLGLGITRVLVPGSKRVSGSEEKVNAPHGVEMVLSKSRLRRGSDWGPGAPPRASGDGASTGAVLRVPGTGGLAVPCVVPRPCRRVQYLAPARGPPLTVRPPDTPSVCLCAPSLPPTCPPPRGLCGAGCVY